MSNQVKIKKEKNEPLSADDIQEPKRTYKLMRPSRIAGMGPIEEDVDFETFVTEILKNINGTMNALAKRMSMQRVPRSLVDTFKSR